MGNRLNSLRQNIRHSVKMEAASLYHSPKVSDQTLTLAGIGG